MVNGENSLYTDEDNHIELKILKYFLNLDNQFHFGHIMVTDRDNL